MNIAPQSVFLNKRITVKVLRDYILDAGVTDVDTIMLNQADFDELALEYRNEYNQHLPFPYLLLGVLIREEAKGAIRRGSVIVVENDTESLRVNPSEVFDPDRIIYRCGYCGSLVGSNGEELDSKEHKWCADYLNKFGNKVNVQHKRGYCCEHEWNPRAARFQPIKPKVDYSVIKDKSLMELTEEDFLLIGLDKGETPQFEIIYPCSSARSGKIYFTPNNDSYSLRGHMLREHEKIFTTDQLIKAVRDWRRD
jgi:hypothetical protein